MAIDHQLPDRTATTAARRLNDGREFEIVKVLRGVFELALRLQYARSSPDKFNNVSFLTAATRRGPFRVCFSHYRQAASEKATRKGADMSIVLDRARIWTRTLPVFGLLFLLTPDQARAQVVATSFEELKALVRRGDTIDITDASGKKTKGRLGELSPMVLELLVRKTGPDGRDTFIPQVRSEPDIRQIWREHRDSVWNGSLIGTAVGAGPWLLVGALAAASGGGSCGSDSNFCPYVALYTGPIGAGIGVLIDAWMRKRTTVYYRSAIPQSSALRVSPIASKSSGGIQLSVRF